MIKATDYRYGNYVILTDFVTGDSYPYQFDFSDLHELESFPDENEDRYAPMPLTPDVLTKFQFSGDRYEHPFWGLDVLPAEGIVYNFPLEVTDTEIAWNFTFCGTPYRKVFKYVHELQNLMLDLCGVELQIRD